MHLNTPGPARTLSRQSGFWLLAVVLVAILVGVWHLPRHTKAESSKRWQLRLPNVHKPLRRMFLVSVTAVLSAYSVGARMLWLGSQIAHDLIGSSNVLVNGSAISLFAVAVGVTGIIGRRFTPDLSIILGGGFAAGRGRDVAGEGGYCVALALLSPVAILLVFFVPKTEVSKSL